MRRFSRNWSPLVLLLLLLGGAGWTLHRHRQRASLDLDLLVAVQAVDPARVDVLLDRGADPDARPPMRTPYVWQRILAAGFNPRTSTGTPALAWASRIGRDADTVATRRNRAMADRAWAVAAALLRHGADPNDADVEGTSPLMCASLSGRPDVVRLLLARGANPAKRDAWGHTAVYYAVRSVRGPQGLSCLRTLLDHGADPNDKEVLDAAVWMRRPQMVALLLARGAKADPGSSLPGLGRTTPLWVAANLGCDDLAKLLLRHGADPTVRGGTGRTPAQMAGARPLRHLLLQAEADWRRRHPPAPMPRSPHSAGRRSREVSR